MRRIKKSGGYLDKQFGDPNYTAPRAKVKRDSNVGLALIILLATAVTCGYLLMNAGVI